MRPGVETDEYGLETGLPAPRVHPRSPDGPITAAEKTLALAAVALI
jgi:hypothetical protein